MSTAPALEPHHHHHEHPHEQIIITKTIITNSLTTSILNR